MSSAAPPARPSRRHAGARAAWKTSQPSGITDSAIAATQDTNTPAVGTAAAIAISSASFAAEKIVLPTGTHSALRSPVSTPSCSVSSDQPITAAMNPRPCEVPCRKRYDGPQKSSVSRNTAAAKATIAELPAYVRRISRPALRPDTGMKRVSAPVSVTAISPARNFIAAIAAEPWPTASSV